MFRRVERLSTLFLHKPLPHKLMSEKFPPTRPVPSFLVHCTSRDGNQNSRAFRYHSDCVEKIQDGGQIQMKFPKIEKNTLVSSYR